MRWPTRTAKAPAGLRPSSLRGSSLHRLRRLHARVVRLAGFLSKRPCDAASIACCSDRTIRSSRSPDGCRVGRSRAAASPTARHVEAFAPVGLARIARGETGSTRRAASHPTHSWRWMQGGSQPRSGEPHRPSRRSIRAGGARADRPRGNRLHAPRCVPPYAFVAMDAGRVAAAQRRAPPSVTSKHSRRWGSRGSPARKPTPCAALRPTLRIYGDGCRVGRTRAAASPTVRHVEAFAPVGLARIARGKPTPRAALRPTLRILAMDAGWVAAAQRRVPPPVTSKHSRRWGSRGSPARKPTPCAALRPTLRIRGEWCFMGQRTRLAPHHDIGSGSRSSPMRGGSGMNSSWSRSGSFMRPACQSARAWSMRSFEDDTKFQSM